MDATRRVRAPEGRLDTFARESFRHGGEERDLYRKGSGPAVIVIAELPGITPHVLGFADRVVALGFTAVLPVLFGQPGRDPYAGSKISQALYAAGTAARACVSRQFTAFALGRTAPAVHWLRALAAAEHARCGGPGVGVVGMCFTGGFALAMATDPHVLAPVVSQPSLPIPLDARRGGLIDCDPADLAVVAGRCASEGLRVLGLRFRGDPIVPGRRFAYLREKLGDGFIAIELEQSDGHPESAMKHHHSVLTGDLIDEPGEKTRAALERVLEHLRDRLLTERAS